MTAARELVRDHRSWRRARTADDTFSQRRSCGSACFVPTSASDSAHADIFHLDIFFDAVLRSLAPHARLLDAAEGCHLGGDEPRVHSDHAVFERFGNAPDAP